VSEAKRQTPPARRQYRCPLAPAAINQMLSRSSSRMEQLSTLSELFVFLSFYPVSRPATINAIRKNHYFFLLPFSDQSLSERSPSMILLSEDTFYSVLTMFGT
jgi:hypothetical protein